jgi:hypothetical protein
VVCLVVVCFICLLLCAWFVSAYMFCVGCAILPSTQPTQPAFSGYAASVARVRVRLEYAVQYFLCIF